MIQEFSFLVNGQWRKSAEKYDLHNPYNGETIAIVNRAGPGDIQEAIEAAERAFSITRKLPGYKRAEILENMHLSLRRRKEEFAQALTLEAGKPIVDARAEVERAITTFQVAGEEAKRTGGEVIPLDIVPAGEGRGGITRRFPIGPITGITPFNFPLNLVAHKLAPCIASGNTMLLRPASQTPICSLLLGQVACDAGVPAGALNVLPCTTKVAEPLVADERIKMLTFTGSPEVGWELKARAGKKKVLLELGGNAGVVINDDADLETAARKCASGGFYFAGQSCISVQRILVKESVYQDFLARLIDQVKKIKIGDPLDETTEMGPVITAADAERIQSWTAEAVAQGAKLAVGGERQGSLFEPTVLLDTKPDMKVNCLEVFAPLITVSPFSSFEEAIEVINDSIYGLQTGIFTNDLKAVLYAFDHLDVGGVIVNDAPSFRVDHMPYGGVKNSGFGREGLKYAIEEMTEIKLLVLPWG